MSSIPKPFDVVNVGGVWLLIMRNPVENSYSIVEIIDHLTPDAQIQRLEHKREKLNELFAKWWQSAIRHAKYLSQTEVDD